MGTQYPTYQSHSNIVDGGALKASCMPNDNFRYSSCPSPEYGNLAQMNGLIRKLEGILLVFISTEGCRGTHHVVPMPVGTLYSPKLWIFVRFYVGIGTPLFSIAMHDTYDPCRLPSAFATM
jgi:hypothetical protein